MGKTTYEPMDSWEESVNEPHDALNDNLTKMNIEDEPKSTFRPNPNAAPFVLNTKQATASPVSVKSTPSAVAAAAPADLASTTIAVQESRQKLRAEAPVAASAAPVSPVIATNVEQEQNVQSLPATAVDTQINSNTNLAPAVAANSSAVDNQAESGSSEQFPAVSNGSTARRANDVVQTEQEAEIDMEVVEEMYGKEHVNIVFIGHVDAGKSTLGGNLLYLTGMVDQRTMDKYLKDARDQGVESWYLSWALDTNKEERAEGKTVEVGRAFFETEKRKYSVLDAPGHRGYVSNMISGAAQADVGILVISARKGEYETGFEKGGQTREHALLARTQGVNKLIIAVNKMDDSTVNWSKERYEECTVKLSHFLRKEAGYNPKTDIYCIPVSAYTGANLKDRVSKKVCPWWEGPSLLEYLDNMKTLERKLNAPFMMPISSKFKDLGCIVEGKIESGVVHKKDKILLMPENKEIEVITVFNEQDEEVEKSVCGEQTRLKVRGVEEEVLNISFENFKADTVRIYYQDSF